MSAELVTTSGIRGTRVATQFVVQRRGAERVAAELVRVCRPGGRIVMANWKPEGHVGQMFRSIVKHVQLPERVPQPLQ